jgi:hypothetical protein
MGIQKVKDDIKWGVLCKVNCGKQTRFGEDVWIGKIPPKTGFSQPVLML